MKLLIIGGTGNISREITQQAAEAGHQVTIFNRGRRLDAKTLKGVRVITGDRSVPGALEEGVKGLDFDAVIDMISYNVQDARTTMSVFDGRVGHVIFTSSVAAYVLPMKEFPATEGNVRLRTEGSFAYGFNKAQMERFLFSAPHQSPVTIIRPSLTFGVGCQNIGVLRQNANIFRRIRDGRPLVMFGDGTSIWSFTFAPDMGSAYVKALFRQSTFNRAFHVTSGHVNIFEDLYTTIGNIAGRRPVIVHATADMLMAFNPTLFEHISLEKKYGALFDCSSFRSAVPDWRPQLDLQTGMEQICQWWVSQGLPFDPDKDALEDKICTSVQRFIESV